MAEPSKSRKPRVRKTAPTLREKAQAAQTKAASAKPKRRSRLAAILKWPFAKLKLPDNRFTRVLRRVGRFISKVLGWFVPRYFVNAWRELRQVTWPGRVETWRLTLAVFIFAIVFGALVFGVDLILDKLFRDLVLK